MVNLTAGTKALASRALLSAADEELARAAYLEMFISIARDELDAYREEDPNSPHLYGLEVQFASVVHAKALALHRGGVLRARAEQIA